MGMIRALFRRRRLDEILDDEIRRHIELQTDEYMRDGLSSDDAQRAALKRFGHVAAVKEDCRAQNRVAGVEALWQDLRFGLRSFASQPGFTVVVLLTLALGIGANTAMFSVLRAVLLEGLPLPEPDRVVRIWENDRLRGSTKENASYPDFLDIRESARRFEHLGAAQRMNVTLTGRGEAERVPAERVSSSYFAALGLDPVMGRVFGPGEGGVVLSYGLWQRKFAGSKDVIGSAISLDGYVGSVIGVMPPEASGLTFPNPDVWTSLETVKATQFRGQHTTSVLGRLRPDATIGQAQAELDAIMARLEEEYPDDNLGRGAAVVALHEELAGTMRPALRAQTITVVVLLLIACLNIANMLLARASARGREMAIRVSLGAGRSRLARQLLTESGLLAVAGAALGLAFGWWGVRGLVALAPPGTPLIERAAVDESTLLATIAVSLAAWAIFGVLPALRASAAPPAGGLHGSGRTTAAQGSLRLRNTLVTGQIALAAVLVIFSGLLIRSVLRLQQVSLGYETRGAISLRIQLPEKRYPWPPFPFREWPALFGFVGRVKEAVAELPGVETVSVAIASPARSSWTTRVAVEGRPAIPQGEQDEAEFRTADPDYLRAAGAQLLRGRFFAETDDRLHPLVSVVNEAFVRRHFPGEDPLGRRIVAFGDPREVVGVVKDMRYKGPGSAPEPAMYFPFRQAPFPNLTLVVRTASDPARLTEGLRQAVRTADPNVAPFDVKTLERSSLDATARERFVMSLLTGFAILALVLAVVGIYGVVAFSVSRRLKEIAIRRVVGARAGEIVWRIVGGTLARTSLGVGVGIAVASLVAPIFQPLVFETSTRDGITYMVVASVFVGAALLGASVPAARAVRVNTASTLRQD